MAEERRRPCHARWGHDLSMGRTLEKLAPALYSPECAEGLFCQLRIDGVLRSSLRASYATLAAKITHLGDTPMLSFIDTSVDVAYTAAQVFGFFIPPPLYGKVFGHGRKRGTKERSARRVDEESKKAGRRAAPAARRTSDRHYRGGRPVREALLRTMAAGSQRYSREDASS